jgi:hypothetical protein
MLRNGYCVNIVAANNLKHAHGARIVSKVALAVVRTMMGSQNIYVVDKLENRLHC